MKFRMKKVDFSAFLPQRVSSNPLEALYGKIQEKVKFTKS